LLFFLASDELDPIPDFHTPSEKSDRYIIILIYPVDYRFVFLASNDNIESWHRS